MNNLANSYADAGRSQDALKLHEETLQLRKAKLGPDHPDTLESMNNVAACYIGGGEAAKAVTILQHRKVTALFTTPKLLEAVGEKVNLWEAGIRGVFCGGTTMAPQYESVVLETFYAFFEKGFVYKGLRSVYWCIHDETALAEAEVEYENHTSPTVWVKYPLTGDPATLDPALKDKKVFTVIWTTTPWTLPASMAVAFHPDEDYVALESEGEVYIVAEKLASEFAGKAGLPPVRKLAHFRGKKLEYRNFAHPFLDRLILGVLADYVAMDTGTGVVHTAPSHGAEDFATGVKYKLDLTGNVDESGIVHNGLPEYEGKKVFDANAPIVQLPNSTSPRRSGMSNLITSCTTGWPST